MRRLASAVLLSAAALGCSGGGGETTTAGKAVGKAVGKTTTTAGKPAGLPQKADHVFDCEVRLHQEYGANVAAADQKYTGKVVEIQLGRGRLEKLDNGVYVIVLHASVGQTADILCAVHKDSLPKLAAAKLGGAFHLRGRCLGRRKSAESWDGYAVGIADCEVLDVLIFQDGKGWVSGTK